MTSCQSLLSQSRGFSRGEARRYQCAVGPRPIIIRTAVNNTGNKSPWKLPPCTLPVKPQGGNREPVLFPASPRLFPHSPAHRRFNYWQAERRAVCCLLTHTHAHRHTLTIIAPLAETDARVLLSKLVGESRIAPANLRRKPIACCVSRLKNSSAAPSFSS